MLEISNYLRLIKRSGHNGDTWIGQELFPADTWKNRQLWKPVTRPLDRTEVLAWLTRRCPDHNRAEQISRLIDQHH